MKQRDNLPRVPGNLHMRLMGCRLDAAFSFVRRHVCLKSWRRIDCWASSGVQPTDGRAAKGEVYQVTILQAHEHYYDRGWHR